MLLLIRYQTAIPSYLSSCVSWGMQNVSKCKMFQAWNICMLYGYSKCFKHEIAQSLQFRCENRLLCELFLSTQSMKQCCFELEILLKCSKQYISWSGSNFCIGLEIESFVKCYAQNKLYHFAYCIINASYLRRNDINTSFK